MPIIERLQIFAKMKNVWAIKNTTKKIVFAFFSKVTKRSYDFLFSTVNVASSFGQLHIKCIQVIKKWILNTRDKIGFNY